MKRSMMYNYKRKCFYVKFSLIPLPSKSVIRKRSEVCPTCIISLSSQTSTEGEHTGCKTTSWLVGEISTNYEFSEKLGNLYQPWNFFMVVSNNLGQVRNFTMCSVAAVTSCTGLMWQGFAVGWLQEWPLWWQSSPEGWTPRY